MSSCLSVCTSVTSSFLDSVHYFFSELLRSDRDLETEKSDRDGFPKHIVVCPKMDKKGSK